MKNFLKLVARAKEVAKQTGHTGSKKASIY